MMYGLLLEAAATAGYLLVDGFPSFVLFASLVHTLDIASRVSGGALVGSAFERGTRVRVRALQRVAINLGIGVGSLCAAFAISWGGSAVYGGLITFDAATFLLAAVVFRAFPKMVPTVRTKGTRTRAGGAAVRVRPYVAVTALLAVLQLQRGVLNVALPLWVVTRTEAPPALVGILFVTNTVIVVTFEVRLARGCERVSGSRRACVRAARLLLLACVLIGSASMAETAVAVALLLLGGARVRRDSRVRRRVRPVLRPRRRNPAGRVSGGVQPRGSLPRRSSRRPRP